MRHRKLQEKKGLVTSIIETIVEKKYLKSQNR